MGLLTTPALRSVKFMDGLCLSIIALAAGAELRISELRRTQRQVCKIMWCCCSLVDLQAGCLHAVGGVLGSVGMH